MENSNKWVGAYWLLVLMTFIFAAGPAMGASSGTTGASFLKVSVGPRAAAMGSAYAAVTEEPYAMHYNPASLVGTERWQLSAMHQDQFAQINFDYVGLAAPVIRGRSALGISLIRMASVDYFRTETDDGTKFTNQDLALTGTYAHRIFKPLALGGSFKLIRQTLATYNANGWAMDFGAHLKVNPRLSIGASIVNIGPEITFISIGDPLPTTVRVGGAFKLLPRGNLLATMDYWIPRDDADAVGIGVEYRPNPFLAFRGGYQIGSDFTGFDASTYGLTFNFDNFGIEYAFVPREKLGDVHRAGLNVTFGGRKPEVVAAKPDKSRRRRKSMQETETAYRPARETPAESIYGEQPRRQESGVDRPASSAASVQTQLPAAQPEAPSKASPTEAAPQPLSKKSFSDQMSLRPAESQSELSEVRAEPAPVAPSRQQTIRQEPVAQEMAVSAADQMPSEDKSAIIQEKVSLAASLLKQNRFEEASVIIKSGLREDPKNVPLWYLLSETYYKAGDYDRAMEAVSKALAIIHGDRAAGRP